MKKYMDLKYLRAIIHSHNKLFIPTFLLSTLDSYSTQHV